MVIAGREGLNRRVGQRVRALRRRRKLTQEELAGRIERSVEAISNIERGKSAPALETLLRIAAALGVRPADLLDPGPVDGMSPRRAGMLAGINDGLAGLDDHGLRVAAQLVDSLAER